MNNELSPYVSVIVPIYKTQPDYLKQCLNTLHTQTLIEAEFIIIFDGKDVELQSCCESYKRKDSRYKIYIQPHMGVSSTRNYGIKQAKGEYITFVDADDTLFSRKTLNNAYQKAKELESDIVIFSWSLGEHCEKKLWKFNKSELSNVERDFCLKQLLSIQKDSFVGAPWAKLFKRDFLLSNNIFFDEKYTIGQDRIFNYKAFSLATRISYCNLCFYNYNVNENSATQRFRPGYLPTILNYIEELSKLSNNKNPSLIGREAIIHFYISWDKDYMSPLNKKPYLCRMKELVNTVNSDRFQFLIKSVDVTNNSILFKIETMFLRHKITFWIYLHGFKKLFFQKIHNIIRSLICPSL